MNNKGVYNDNSVSAKRTEELYYMDIVFIILISYTIVWFVIWWSVLRYKTKEVDALYEELSKLEEEYNSLKNDYNKLEGRYDELLRITSLRQPTTLYQG